MPTERVARSRHEEHKANCRHSPQSRWQRRSRSAGVGAVMAIFPRSGAKVNQRRQRGGATLYKVSARAR